MPKMEMARFYNAGDQITDRFNYTKSDEDMRVSNCVGYYDMDAQRQRFFDVPREMKTVGGSQFVGLPKEVLDRYGDRGVVMIDRNLTDDEANGEKFVANTDQTAKEKGHELWLTYCRKVVALFEDENEKRVVMGLQKMRAKNFIVHAYKELGMVPPAVNALPVPTAPAAAPMDMDALMARLKKEIMEEMTTPPPAQNTAPAKGKSA
jgi:hypothetical protein